ncbi:MAG: hypothetical protein KF799_03995 [Bdellovibrionales bacterium]|nr:hypothetical protein [Bdellovibrionales bacterium]
MNKLLLTVALILVHAQSSAATAQKKVAATPPPSRSIAQFTPNDEGGVEDEIEDDFSTEETVVTPATPSTPDESDFSAEEDSLIPPADLQPEPAPAPEVQMGQRYEEPPRPSAEQGEKIFDWSKYPNAKEVPHPFREKGLIRITRDKDYIYKVDESEQNRAFDFRIGMFNPINLKNPDNPDQTFANNYTHSDQNPAFLFTYEWQLWNSPIGKWGLRAGAGTFVAQGNGHFEGAVNAGLEPREIFTFVVIPINIGAVYRMQWSKRQLFVPYAEGGGTAFPFTELRDDDKAPKFGGSLGGYFAGGLGINLTYFDALSRIRLDSEYGINSVYLTAEYRAIVSMQRYDFTSDFINAGFLMEY